MHSFFKFVLFIYSYLFETDQTELQFCSHAVLGRHNFHLTDFAVFVFLIIIIFLRMRRLKVIYINDNKYEFKLL